MVDQHSPMRVFISAAEPSADLHASALIRAIHQLDWRIDFCGIAGPKMREAGCRGIFDMTAHSAMLTAVIRHLHHGIKMLLSSYQELKSKKYHAAVVVDSPILNIWIAGIAKHFGVNTLYYIAPQRWAWSGSVSISLLKAWVERIACIWPFEEPYYRSYGMVANYVGHPLFAQLAQREPEQIVIERLKSKGWPVIAIFPGSRRHVAQENFPAQLKICGKLSLRFPELRVLVSIANNQVREVVEQVLRQTPAPVELLENQNPEILRAADLALVVSGTATLEVAFHRTPMIVMYNATRLYQLIRWIINVRYFSLPNILAGRELVPEFMPYYRSIRPIVQRATELLDDPLARSRMSDDLGRLVEPFVSTSASENTAKLLIDMLENARGLNAVDMTASVTVGSVA
ncbi:MAG: Lipid-A-disaccharide synthase [Phycisphaerae bacterium]|nr:Lipid-A-disaccharide synthase [Phycisphaerae bacterium]